MDIRLREAAANDLATAVDYYRDQAGAPVATEFVNSVEAAFGQLRRLPSMGSERFGHELGIPGLRCWPTRDFPYLIFYRVEDDVLDVWRVLHTSNDIPAWMEDS